MLKLKMFVLGTLVTACMTAAWAQTGSIQGVVKDNSGAVIQGADVIVRNIETNAHRAAATSSTGVYSVPNLPVGHYEITAKKDSFKAYHLDTIELTVAQVLGIEITLEPGTVSEEVLVRASDVPAVDLESAQVSNIVDSKRMTSLPLATRDPYELVLLSPGTIQSDSDLGGFSVNGARERNNNFLLDGVDNNDTSVPGGAGGLAALNPDATEEFRVITSNFMPEYGRNNGAIVDVVTKSGSNDWHGGARWFGRYNALGARDYFNHNLDPNTGKVEAQNPYVRNQFGFNFGGPIVKNKTFFFVDADWQRFRTTLTNQSPVPNASFKSMLNGGTFNYTDYDPNDCAPAAAPCSLPISAGGANSTFGLGISPTIQQILSLYPNPNGPAVDQFRGTLFFPSSSRFDARNLTAKIDQHLGDKHLLSIHSAYDWSQDPNGAHKDFLPGGIGASGFEAHTLVGGASLTSTLTSRLVNQAKFAYNKADIPFNCGGLSALNIGATDQYGRPRDFSLPDVAGFGCLALFDSNGQWRKTGTWSWGDNLSWVRGAHTVKVGGDVRFVYENGFNSFTSRSLVTLAPFGDFGVSTIMVNPNLPPCDPFGYFGPINTSDRYQNCGTDASGNPDIVFQDMANTLLGAMDTEQQSQFFDKSGTRTANDLRRFRQHEYDFYVQDSWKLRSNLTLNFGIRYQFNGVPYEVGNNLSNLFENASGPAPDALNPLTTPGCDPTLPTCSGFTFTNVGPGTGHLLYDNNFNNFEPRLGLAWDPFRDGKTSVRAAFGIFHDRVFGNLFGNATGNPPFQQTPLSQTVLNLFSGGNVQPENVPLPATVPTSQYTVDGALFFPTIIAKHFPLPYTTSWNFGIQRELRRDLVLDVNYVGNRGFHEFRVVDGNPPQPALVAANLAGGTDPSQLTFNSLWSGGPGVTSVYNSAFLSAALNQASGNSWYDGLQANLAKHFSRGFQFQAAYTYSHAIDDANDPLVAGEKTNRSFPRNSFALFNERGNSGFDIRHRLVLNYAWDLPVGKRRAYLASGFLGRVLEGWQLAGITTIQSGHPFDLFGNRDSEHTGLSARLDLTGDPSLPAGHPKNQTGVNYAAFDLAPYGQAGNVSKNRFFGPGYNNWDMVMSKDTSIGERVHLQFRTEVFNVFNRTQFDQPGNLLQDQGTFGFSTQTISRADSTTSARQMQFGLKLQF
jgi:Carboxypeptidase regulatory-like domain/TonB dependent receptor-like, beta-barrel